MTPFLSCQYPKVPTVRKNYINDALKVAADFGKDVALDYLSNPANIALVTVAAVSCTVGQVVPVAGQVSCAASARMVATGVSKTAAKLLVKKAIQASISLSSSQKNLAYSIIDATSSAIGLAQMKPNEGLQSLESLGTTYELVANNLGGFVLKNGEIKGLSLPVQIKGTNTIFMISVFKR